MTADDFREMALALPDSEERAHMQHPDFRVKGKVFATLDYPRAGYAMVKLTKDQQELFTKLDPNAFVPVKGAWGAKGATTVVLKNAGRRLTREALLAAWKNIAGAG